MTAGSLEEMFARLLAATPDGYLEERKRIATELKANGRGDDAREIASRKKPTPAVFAINRLRGSPYAKELDRAGEAVRALAHRMLSGDDASAARELAAAQRDQQAVVRAASIEGERLFVASGVSFPATARPKMDDTLRALSTLGQVSRIGTLFEEVEPPDMAKIALLLSFSGDDGRDRNAPSLDPVATPPAPAAPPNGAGRVISFADSKKVRDDRRESERRMAEAKTLARAKREGLDRARADAQQGQRRAIVTKEAMQRAESKVEALEVELAEAKGKSTAARESYERAEEDVRKLEAAVEAAISASQEAADALQAIQDREVEG